MVNHLSGRESTFKLYSLLVNLSIFLILSTNFKIIPAMIYKKQIKKAIWSALNTVETADYLLKFLNFPLTFKTIGTIRLKGSDLPYPFAQNIKWRNKHKVVFWANMISVFIERKKIPNCLHSLSLSSEIIGYFFLFIILYLLLVEFGSIFFSFLTFNIF